MDYYEEDNCRNYRYCGDKKEKENELCPSCEMQMGYTKEINEKEICYVCLENKRMIKLHCGHKICNNCWYIITKYIIISGQRKILCPICKKDNSFNI